MVFKLYDIRGVYPNEIDEKFAYSLGRTLGKIYKKILFGIDSRISSEKFKDPFLTGVLNSDADIVYAGIISTPLMYFLTKNRYDLGVSATASHNPKEFGGFKMCDKDGMPLSPINEVKPFFKEYEIPLKLEKAKNYYQNLGKEYRDFYLKIFKDVNSNIGIVVDFSNGATIHEKKVIEDIFLDKNFLSEKPDGNFPDHLPNTMTEDNLRNLMSKVKEKKANIGIIFDGDGDRLGIVDEKGNPIKGDILTAMIANQILNEKKGTIIYDLRCSKVVPETVIEQGGKPIKSRVGHYFIKKLMREKDAIFAGELSNHFYFKEAGGFEAPLLALFYIFKELEDKKLSEISKRYQKYYQSGEMNFEVDNKEKIMNSILLNYKDAKVETIDGISIYYEDWWANIRPSNTEALLRINIESSKKNILEEKIKEINSIVENNI